MSTKPDSMQLLLLQGWIRSVNKLLNKKAIIPIELIELCFLFYAIPTKIFMVSGSNSTMKFHCFDQKNKTISTLISNNDNNTNMDYSYESTFCFIPNASLSINNLLPDMNSHKSYDCIFSLINKITFSSCTCYYKMRFFESDESNDIIKYYSYISPVFAFRQYYSESTSLIYCGMKHGVIYSNEGNLYKLLLQDVDCSITRKWFGLNHPHFSANNAISQKQMFLQSEIADADPFLAINYMKKQEKIFGVTCKMYDDYNCSKQVAKCGIFDLNTNEWEVIKGYEYILPKDYECFTVGLCSNEDDSLMYMVTNAGNTAKYDICKGKWIYYNVINEKLRFDDECKPTIWTNENPYILYGIRCGVNSSYGCIDTRDYCNKWNELHEFELKSIRVKSRSLFL